MCMYFYATWYLGTPKFVGMVQDVQQDDDHKTGIQVILQIVHAF